MREVTNIIKLSKLFKTPCGEWLERFDKQRNINAYEAFKRYGNEYRWLYENSNYDLISWEIQNNLFNWEKYSWAVAQYCPEHFDKDKFNWDDDSWAITQYCSEHFDKDKFNWEKYSWAVAQYCPEHFDKDKFNWEKYSWAVAQYCPERLSERPA